MGPYTLLEELGHGGMGVVHRAVHATLGRQVAIKLIRADLLGGKRDYLDRFHREIEIMTKLSHPNIVKVLDGGTENGQTFLVMEILVARTLREIIKQGVPPLPVVFSVLDQVADALDYIHGRGMLHRDIKPENIMVDASDRAILMDFGLARADGSVSLTGSQDVLGTPRYFAPELVMFEAASPASDLWALGCTTYLMLTGKHAFDAENTRALMGAILRSEPAPLPATVPDRLQKLLARLLIKDRSARLSSAAELRRELDDIATELAAANLPPEPPPAPEPPPPESRLSGSTRRARSGAISLSVAPPLPARPAWFYAVPALLLLPLLLLLFRPSSTPSPAPSPASPSASLPATPTEPDDDTGTFSRLTHAHVHPPLDAIWKPIRTAIIARNKTANLQDLTHTVGHRTGVYAPLTTYLIDLERTPLPAAYRAIRPHLPELLTSSATPIAELERLLSALTALDMVDALATMCGHPPPFLAQAALTPLLELAMDDPPPRNAVPLSPVLSAAASPPATAQAYLIYVPEELPNEIGNAIVNLSDAHLLKSVEDRDRKPTTEVFVTPPATLDRAKGLRFHFRVHGLGKQTYLRLWPPGFAAWLPVRLPDGQPPKRKTTYWLSATIRGPLARRDGAWRIAQGRAFMADPMRAGFALDEAFVAPAGP